MSVDGVKELRPHRASPARMVFLPTRAEEDFLTALRSDLRQAIGTNQCTIDLAPGWQKIVANWLRLSDHSLARPANKNGAQARTDRPMSVIRVGRRGSRTEVRARLILGGATAAQVIVTVRRKFRMGAILRTLASIMPVISSRLCLHRLYDEASMYARRRLAEELHDGPLQIATAAKIRLQAQRRFAKDPKIAGGLDEAIGMTAEIIAAMRKLMRRRVESLRSRSFRSRLRRSAEYWGQLTSVHVKFHFRDGIADDPSLSQETVETAERVVGESIVNAWKHGGATRVWVNCHSKDGGISLIARDDGRRMRRSRTPRASKGANGTKAGLRFLRADIADLGGRLEVRSRQGGGTTVESWFPGKDTDFPAI